MGHHGKEGQAERLAALRLLPRKAPKVLRSPKEDKAFKTLGALLDAAAPRVAELRSKGWEDSRIAESIGIRPSYVPKAAAIARRLGLEMPPPHVLRHLRVLVLFEEGGLSPAAIADRLDMDLADVSYSLGAARPPSI